MNMLKGKIQAFLYICIENYNFQIVILIFYFFFQMNLNIDLQAYFGFYLLYDFNLSIKFNVKTFVKNQLKFYNFQK